MAAIAEAMKEYKYDMYFDRYAKYDEELRKEHRPERPPRGGEGAASAPTLASVPPCGGTEIDRGGAAVRGWSSHHRTAARAVPSSPFPFPFLLHKVPTLTPSFPSLPPGAGGIVGAERARASGAHRTPRLDGVPRWRLRERG